MEVLGTLSRGNRRVRVGPLVKRIRKTFQPPLTGEAYNGGMHTGFFIVLILAVLAGLAYRLLSLGSGAARFGFLPEKWQRWFLNGHSHPAPPRK